MIRAKQDDAAEKLLFHAYCESFDRLKKLWQEGERMTRRRWGVCGERAAMQAAIRDMDYAAQELAAVLARM